MKPHTARLEEQSLRLEKIYPHPPERVWDALTNPRAVAEWLLPGTFKPVLGHRFHFWRNGHRGKREKVRCQVVELEEARRLAYTWQAESDERPTLVTWTLEPAENGTSLCLEHIGLEPSDTPQTVTNRISNVKSVSLLDSFDVQEMFSSIGFLSDADTSTLYVQMGRIILNTHRQSLRCVRRHSTRSAGSARCVRSSVRSEEVLSCNR